MKKTDKGGFINSISINPYTKLFYVNQNNFLQKKSACNYTKQQICISTLATQDYITTQLSISRNIEDEDLYDAIYTKVYDELALDQAITYEIRYIEIFDILDDKNRNFHIFIVNPDNIIDSFKNAVEQIKYIDYIIPTPLLFKMLYNKKIVSNVAIQAYLYFLHNDAFIAIYKDGEFLYSKSINYSLLQMHLRFCEFYGEKIKYEEFINILSTVNLKSLNIQYTQSFIKLYKEIFSNINDILSFVKKAYGINKISSLYIGSEVFFQTKIDEIAQLELAIKCHNLEFDYGFKKSNEYIDTIQYLMHLYLKESEESTYDCNFTLFPRPAKLIKRVSGQLLFLSAASFFLAFTYPVLYWSLGYFKSLEYDEIKQKSQTLYTQRMNLANTLKEKKALHDKTGDLLEKEILNYKTKKETLTKIHEIKVNYPMKAKIIYFLTTKLNDHDILIQSIFYNEQKNIKNFTFNLISDKDRDVTQFLEDITNTSQENYLFTLENISFDKELNKYTSKLKVVLL